MKFSEKYTLDNTVKDEEEKIMISKESFAVCEMMQSIIINLNRMGLNK